MTIKFGHYLPNVTDMIFFQRRKCYNSELLPIKIIILTCTYWKWPKTFLLKLVPMTIKFTIKTSTHDMRTFLTKTGRFESKLMSEDEAVQKMNEDKAKRPE